MKTRVTVCSLVNNNAYCLKSSVNHQHDKPSILVNHDINIVEDMMEYQTWSVMMPILFKTCMIRGTVNLDQPCTISIFF